MQGPRPETARERPPRRGLLALKRLLVAAPRPIEFQILGRVLLHAALVGAAAGLLGSLFFAGVEAVQRVGLESLTGYVPLRAATCEHHARGRAPDRSRSTSASR